jgi:predicted nucleotidyltransferase
MSEWKGVNQVLSHEDINKAVTHIASIYPVKKASYFGSYAEGRQTDASDLDVLLEFIEPAVSLFTISAIKFELEDQLKIPVDVIHAPLADDSLISIGKVIRVYG